MSSTQKVGGTGAVSVCLSLCVCGSGIADKSTATLAHSAVRNLKEELQQLQEQGSHVGEVVKPMDKQKVLVKVLPRSICCVCSQHVVLNDRPLPSFPPLLPGPSPSFLSPSSSPLDSP